MNATKTLETNSLSTSLPIAASDKPKTAASPNPSADAELNHLLKLWNKTERPYSRSRCIHQLFEEQVERTPNAIALVHRDREMTYQELNDQAEALAGKLRAAGVGPEVPVGICLRRSPEMVVGLYAILKAGGAYVPLDPGYPRERLSFMLEDTKAPVLLTQEALRTLLPPVKSEVICVDGAATPSPREPITQITAPNSENLAYVIYTSGSTGMPKGVMIRHRNVVNFFSGMDEVLGTQPGVWLAVTSISFDISVLELFWTLTRGFKVVLLDDETSRSREPAEAARAKSGAACTAAEQIPRHGVTHLQCTPSLARLMLQQPKIKDALMRVRHLLFGGEALPPELVQQFEGKGDILNMYGPTETTVWSAVHPVTRTGGAISLGSPIANTRIYILDDQLKPVPAGVSGELFIGGDGVARGYWGRPELTAERFVPDPFVTDPESRLYRTGDMAWQRPDGTLQFLGRIDQQVKVRGHRIELGEIEAAICQCPGVDAAAVTVWEPAPDNQQLAAYFVPSASSGAEPSAIKQFLKNKLPAHMLPSFVTSLPKLPLTPNGKTDRRALPIPKTLRKDASPAAPGNPRQAGERKVPLTEAQREIWYASQMSKAVSSSFNVSVKASLRGHLEVPRLVENVTRLAARHEALRITCSADGETQCIHAPVPAQVPLIDLSPLSPESQRSELERHSLSAVDEPFDLARGPLWRALLLRLSPDHHMLVLTAHHLICDGSSLNILLHELSSFYSSDATVAPEWETPPSFSEFVQEAETARNSMAREKAERHWTQLYATPPQALELPLDHPRPLRRSYASGSQTLIIGTELARRLKRFSSAQRCSLLTPLLAGYGLLLRHLGGQTEMVIGLPITTRAGEKGERLVGHCVNFLPLRIVTDPESSFEEHLRRVRSALLDSQEHHHFTLGSLLQKLKLPRAAGRMPLVSVMFNFDWVGEEVRLAGLQATQIPNPSSYCRYDLSFNFNEIAGELRLLCQYSTELFNPETIRRWLADYELLLSESVAHPEQSLGELCRRTARARSSQPENAGSAAPPTITAGQPSGEAPEPPAAAGPLTPTEQALAEIWQEVIGLETVERNDDFFDVGGHSLLAMQIIARITRVFNVELPLGTIFEAPKLGALAEVITQLRREQPGGASVIPRREADQKQKMLQRLANLSEAQFQELLRNPKLKDIES